MYKYETTFVRMIRVISMWYVAKSVQIVTPDIFMWERFSVLLIFIDYLYIAKLDSL